MRTASMVLGIVGGTIALLLSLVLILFSVAISNESFWNNTYDSYDDFDSWDYPYDFDWSDDLSSLNELAYHDSNILSNSYYDAIDDGRSIASTVFLIPGICAAIAGIIGLIGGIIVKKKNIISGVLMIIAAVLSLLSFFNIISMVLFILGSIFALKQVPQNTMSAYPQQFQQQYQPQQYQPQQFQQQQQPNVPQPQPAPPKNPPEQPQP